MITVWCVFCQIFPFLYLYMCLYANMYAWVLSRFSCVRLFVTPWTVACQAPVSIGFFRQEYWSGLTCPPPGDFPDPGVKPASLMSPALAGGFFTTEPPGKPMQIWGIDIHGGKDSWDSFIVYTESQPCTRNTVGAANKTGTLNLYSNEKVQVINLTKL